MRLCEHKDFEQAILQAAGHFKKAVVRFKTLYQYEEVYFRIHPEEIKEYLSVRPRENINFLCVNKQGRN